MKGVINMDLTSVSLSSKPYLDEIGELKKYLHFTFNVSKLTGKTGDDGALLLENRKKLIDGLNEKLRPLKLHVYESEKWEPRPKDMLNTIMIRVPRKYGESECETVKHIVQTELTKNFGPEFALTRYQEFFKKHLNISYEVLINENYMSGKNLDFDVIEILEEKITECLKPMGLLLTYLSPKGSPNGDYINVYSLETVVPETYTDLECNNVIETVTVELRKIFKNDFREAYGYLYHPEKETWLG